jgi:hypothetical protein
MLKRIILATTLFASPLALPAHAQMQHDSTDIIDGSTNPELIPDHSAYRLYFLSVTQPPQAPISLAEQVQARLKFAGLSVEDRKLAVPILSTFRTKYDSLIADYNQIANKSRDGTDVDSATLFKRRKTLVGDTQFELQHALSQEGIKALDTFVQQEKRRMLVAGAERE